MPAHTKAGGLQPVAEVKELAIHLNCIVNPSALQNNVIKIHVEQFHLTVRSLATQKKIDAHGPSIITAGNSIHMNVSTGWGRADNLRALAQEVGVNDDQTLHSELHQSARGRGKTSLPVDQRCVQSLKVFSARIRRQSRRSLIHLYQNNAIRHPHNARTRTSKMASLQGYVDRRVLLVLQDGRAIVGVLAGFDQKSNVVLSESKERVYSMDEGVEEIPLGLYLVKGDMMNYLSYYILFASSSAICQQQDDAIDQAVDLSSIRAEPIPPIRY
ncbi:hypothetical protein J3R82DRAFT_7028 [Butyriboletus roseoflavus]|nr:hypothetical protein J3R82DRAFT_7028 [Butyriboletus roseoflavus]